MELKNKKTSSNTSPISDFERIATRVTMVSIIGNMILSGFKLFSGILAHSGAMISDALTGMNDLNVWLLSFYRWYCSSQVLLSA